LAANAFNRCDAFSCFAVVEKQRSAQIGTSQCTFELATPVPGYARRSEQKNSRILAQGSDSRGGAQQDSRAVNDFVATVF
jgi:hypothetical protein